MCTGALKCDMHAKHSASAALLSVQDTQTIQRRTWALLNSAPDIDATISGVADDLFIGPIACMDNTPLLRRYGITAFVVVVGSRATEYQRQSNAADVCVVDASDEVAAGRDDDDILTLVAIATSVRTFFDAASTSNRHCLIAYEVSSRCSRIAMLTACVLLMLRDICNMRTSTTLSFAQPVIMTPTQAMETVWRSCPSMSALTTPLRTLLRWLHSVRTYRGDNASSDAVVSPTFCRLQFALRRLHATWLRTPTLTALLACVGDGDVTSKVDSDNESRGDVGLGGVCSSDSVFGDNRGAAALFTPLFSSTLSSSSMTPMYNCASCAAHLFSAAAVVPHCEIQGLAADITGAIDSYNNDSDFVAFDIDAPGNCTDIHIVPSQRILFTIAAATMSLPSSSSSSVSSSPLPLSTMLPRSGDMLCWQCRHIFGRFSFTGPRCRRCRYHQVPAFSAFAEAITLDGE